MKKTTPKLSEFTFIPRKRSKTVLTPTFMEEKFADTIYHEYEAEKEKFNNNPNFKLKKECKVITGSNIFDLALIDIIVKPYGQRTTLPQDLTQEVLDMVKDRPRVNEIYTNAIVLRTLNDISSPTNNPLARILADRIDYKESKGPVLITSLTVELFPEHEYYGLKLIPSDKSKIIYDGRLSDKYNGWRFNKIDEIGLPKSLSKNKGARTWYTREDGLSKLGLNIFKFDLFSISNYGMLSASPLYNRIVLVTERTP